MSFIVAIDGPAGAGKGTITKLVGKKLNLVNIDTGITYRCLTLAVIEKGYSVDEKEKIVKLLDEIKIQIKRNNGEEKVFLNNVDVTKEIRMQKVNEFVSQVSVIPEVRYKMAEFQRKMAVGKNVIMEGRDIGTNVFPNANIKIYLDATPEERAKRRMLQNEEKGIKTSYDEILENIIFRDNTDKTRKVSPLKMAEDAIYIDSTNMSIEQVVEKIIKIIEDVKLANSSKKFDKPGDSWWKKTQRRVIWFLFRNFYKIVYRIEVNGEENIPKDGAFIICGNHVDFVKVPVIVLFCPRKVNFIAKAELFKNPILNWLGNLFDVISVKRGKQDVDSMKRSLKVLSNNEGLGLFPEGTRHGLEKGVKVKNGAAFMALRTGKKIVPVGVKVGRNKIVINYGKPLDYSEYKSKNPEKEVLEKVTTEMMNNIVELTKI